MTPAPAPLAPYPLRRLRREPKRAPRSGTFPAAHQGAFVFVCAGALEMRRVRLAFAVQLETSDDVVVRSLVSRARSATGPALACIALLLASRLTRLAGQVTS